MIGLISKRATKSEKEGGLTGKQKVQTAGLYCATINYYIICVNYPGSSAIERPEEPAGSRRYYKNQHRETMIATRSRGYLPHLESQNPIYFVTFRLADSLPRVLLEQLREERQAIQKAAKAGAAVQADQTRLPKLRATIQKAERCLDRGLGVCHLRDPRVAEVVAEAIRFFESKRYQLLAWCVMPNHVHVVFSPLSGYRLESILHSWKSFSAERVNKILGRTGRFWQREYFDHLVRSEESLRRIIEYVRRNPERAGLRDWPWVGIARD